MSVQPLQPSWRLTSLCWRAELSTSTTAWCGQTAGSHQKANFGSASWSARAWTPRPWRCLWRCPWRSSPGQICLGRWGIAPQEVGSVLTEFVINRKIPPFHDLRQFQQPEDINYITTRLYDCISQGNCKLSLNLNVSLLGKIASSLSENSRTILNCRNCK